MARSILKIGFYMEKIETVDVLETIATNEVNKGA